MYKRRWAIAIKQRMAPWALELATAIRDCLLVLDHSVMIVMDGDPKGLDADILLLPVVLGDYPMYCSALRRGGSERPTTLLWLMDPLPPKGMLPEAESIGLKACRWRDRFGLRYPGDLPRWKKLLSLLRLRVWAYKKCSAPGFRNVCRLIRHTHGCEDDWPQIRGVMENWQDILDSHDEGWIDHLIVSTDQRRRFLLNRGIPAYFIPIGAHDSMGRNLGWKRDIPVAFLGSRKYGRRAILLNALGARLKEKGIPFIQVERGLDGVQRCEWFNRIRILVNLHNFSWNPAWLRFLMAARCGTLVVSEPVDDNHPMTAGVHYVAAKLEEMPDVIGRLLEDHSEIDRMTAAADILCKSELTLLHAVEKLTHLVDKRRT